MSRIEEMLSRMGLALPERCTPRGAFLPYRREGSLVFMAGQICEWNGNVPVTGPVLRAGETAPAGIAAVDIDAGKKGAQICALNLLFHLKAAAGGDLDRLENVVRLGGFVQCLPGFDASPAVLNGASDLLIALYGEAGRHARTAVGVSGLPANASVEVDAIFRLKD
ncbi:MAG: RidA family protein [Pseudomonadota bacterium]|nr:RidA family protein [Pseudomonadota bacterium]